MTIQFIGNFTDAMKNYTEEKISKIESKGIKCDHVRVKMEKLPVSRVVEISINNKIRNSKKGEDFYALVIDVVDSICSQVTRYKKYTNKKQDINYLQSEQAEYACPEIAKRKMFFVEEMSEEEAIETMEVLGHDFFIYNDIDNGKRTCVAYKRNDGKYGIIECR